MRRFIVTLFVIIALLAVVVSCSQNRAIHSAAQIVRQATSPQPETLYPRFNPLMQQNFSELAWQQRSAETRDIVGHCEKLDSASEKPFLNKDNWKLVELHMICEKRPTLQVFQVALDDQDQIGGFFYIGTLTEAANFTDKAIELIYDITNGELRQAADQFNDEMAVRLDGKLVDLAKGIIDKTGRCSRTGEGTSKKAEQQEDHTVYAITVECFQGTHSFTVLFDGKGAVADFKYEGLTPGSQSVSNIKDPLAPGQKKLKNPDAIAEPVRPEPNANPTP